MLTQEQIALRHRGIGGSDAAAALGISPWKSQFELYVEKTSEPTRWDQEPRSPEQEWGLRLEEAVADKFAASQGVALYDMKQTLVSDLHPFMVGTPDRIIIPANATHLPHFDGSKLQHADAILELKTARSDYEWGEPGTDQIPLHYLVQTVHYCIVTGLDVAHVAVLFGGSDFGSYVVNCTPDLRDMVYEGERAFWQRVRIAIRLRSSRRTTYASRTVRTTTARSRPSRVPSKRSSALTPFATRSRTRRRRFCNARLPCSGSWANRLTSPSAAFGS